MQDHDRAFLRLDSVSKTYKARASDVVALDRASLTIDRGEFVSLVGPSGCGKSTMLLAIAGLIDITSGAIVIGEREVAGPYTDLGMVFQKPVLLDWRSVEANVMLQSDLRKLDRRQQLERTDHLLGMVGLEAFAKHRPGELSGGMQQRVAICRAIVHNPPLLLMDEPFGALDAFTREQLNLDLQHIWMEGRPTVAFVTHSIEEAVMLSDRVVMMSPRPGRIIDVFPVDFPRPRDEHLRRSTEFSAMVARIRERFDDVGMPGVAMTDQAEVV
ncbi:MAG: ATP-binding cassette domain-containing protein [Actinobacteria bacterium]|nr:ATP-binding cassette domain-containing protein [Actinomycetota bacterium]